MTAREKSAKHARISLFLIGLVAALCITYIAFEWQFFTTEPSSELVSSELPMDTWNFPPLEIKSDQPQGLAEPADNGSNIVEGEEELSNQGEEVSVEGLDSLIIVDDEEEEEIKIPQKRPPKPAIYAEEMPYFPQCNHPDAYSKLKCTSDELDKFLEKNLSIERYRKLKPGLIMVDFVVNEHGKVAEVFVKSQHILHPSIENEIITVFKKQPTYVPAREKNAPVAVWMQKPVHVKVQ